jgi:hypothetical protein
MARCGLPTGSAIDAFDGMASEPITLLVLGKVKRYYDVTVVSFLKW